MSFIVSVLAHCEGTASQRFQFSFILFFGGLQRNTLLAEGFVARDRTRDVEGATAREGVEAEETPDGTRPQNEAMSARGRFRSRTVITGPASGFLGGSCMGKGTLTMRGADRAFGAR